MRYTVYHYNVPVIKDKSLLEDALAKLAHYEDLEENPDIDGVVAGLVKAKHDAISKYNKERIQKGIKLLIKLNNFDETACHGLMNRHALQKQDLLKYIDEVDGTVTDDPVALIRKRVEAME